MKKMERWIKDYIEGIDISNIEWLDLSYDELNKFFDENYVDKSDWSWVRDIDPNIPLKYLDDNFSDQTEREWVRDISSGMPSDAPLGMCYLSFRYMNRDNRYLIGVTPNNIGKKTILAAMSYIDKYTLYTDQKKPMTYVSTVETNLYFWNRGLYNRLCEEAINHLNPEQHIIISTESRMGKIYSTASTLEKILRKNGFDKYFFVSEPKLFHSQEFHDLVCGNDTKVKIKTDNKETSN